MFEFTTTFNEVFIDLLPLFAHHSEARYFPMYSQVSKAWHEVFHKSHSILYIDEYLHSIETLEWALSSGGRCTKFTCEIVGLRTSNFAHFDESMCPVTMISKPYNNDKREKSSLSMEWISGYKKSISLTNLIVRQSPMNVLIHAIENLGFEYDDTTIAAAFTGTDTEKIDYILNLSSIKKNFMLARMAAKYGGRDTVDHIINKYKLRVKPSVIDRELAKYGSYVEGAPIGRKYVDSMWAKAIIRDDVQLLEDVLSRIDCMPISSNLPKLIEGAIASREFLAKLIELIITKEVSTFHVYGSYLIKNFTRGLMSNMDLIPKTFRNSVDVHLYLRHPDESIDNKIDSALKYLCSPQFLIRCVEHNNLRTLDRIMTRAGSGVFRKGYIRKLLKYSLEHKRMCISEYLLGIINE